MRSLLREISRESTILLSSHLLSEVTDICGRALVLGGGRLIYDGPMSALMRPKGELRLAYAGEANMTEALSGLPGVREVIPRQGGATLRCEPGADVRAAVFHLFENSGAALLEMSACAETLEDAFLRLTREEAKAE